MTTKTNPTSKEGPISTVGNDKLIENNAAKEIPSVESPSLSSLLWKKHPKSSFAMYREVSKDPRNKAKLGNLFYYMKLMFIIPIATVFVVWYSMSFLRPIFDLDESSDLMIAAVCGVLAVNAVLYKYTMLAWSEEEERLSRIKSESKKMV